MDNANTKDYLDKIRAQVVENLKRTAFAPSVQMTDVPRDPLVDGMDDEADAILDDLDEDENKDKRYTKRRFDQYIEKPGELSDSDDEEENAANGVRPQPNALKRRNQINYRGLDTADSGIESGLATPHEPSSVADDDLDTTGDARMGEAPEPETGSPSAAEPESREEASALEAPDVPMGGQEEPASAAISRQPSPNAQGEDTTMEDVKAVSEPTEEKEPEQTEPAEQPQPEERAEEQPEQPEKPQTENVEAPATEAAQLESKPEEAAPETASEPRSPPKPESPKEAPEPAAETAKSPEPAKEQAAPAETDEPAKETAPEKPEEPTKQEE